MNGEITVFVYDKRDWEIGHVIIKQIARKRTDIPNDFLKSPRYWDYLRTPIFLRYSSLMSRAAS